MPPRTIRLKVRLALRPEPDGPGWSGTISVPRSFGDLPLSWKLRDFLWNAVKASGGGSDLFREISAGQYDVTIERLQFAPPIESGISMEEFGRLAHVLYWLLSGMTTSLLGGIIGHWQHPRFVNQPNPGPEWFVVQAERVRGGFSSGLVGGGFPTRDVAEQAMPGEYRARGYRVVEARDSCAAPYAYLGLPEPPELRHGQYMLTPEQARAVRPGDRLYHLGRRRTARVLRVVLDGPGAPLFETERGLETYTLFRLPTTQTGGDSTPPERPLHA